MSRIGKEVIEIPNGVEVSENNGVICVKKANNKLEVDTHKRVKIIIKDNILALERIGEDKASSAFWGTYRALANNAINGVNEGFSKQLEINGVGYRASVKGSNLELALGYSHPVVYAIPAGIEISVEGNKVNIKGVDKQQVGQVAADIRSFRKPEPYKGKGIKYSDERIIRKAGKTAK